MSGELAIFLLGSFFVAVFLTAVARKLAISNGLFDVPNERSSHVAPTPRGGGIAIAIATSASWLVALLRGVSEESFLLGLVLGGMIVAFVGYLDDRFQLSAGIRLTAHFGAAIWVLYWLGGVPPIQVGPVLVDLGLAGYPIGCLGIVWTLNLFNFMDGIDGIAASEAIFVVFAGSFLAISTGDPSPVAILGASFGAACCGFLLWNWPPAKIFMGDVGSGYLGYAIAVLALTDAIEHGASLWIWLILGGVFFVDATVTLVRRLARGERAHQAHRTHAYQWLSRRWGSHRKVTLAVLAVNVFWLLPLAWTATRFPGEAYWLAIVALLPLVVAALLAGAGRPE